MFKYGILDFVYVHQIITSLARTEMLFTKVKVKKVYGTSFWCRF